MGAYENVGIIRDRSQEIYGQVIQGIGQQTAQGIISYNQKQEKLQEEKEKTNTYNQNMWFDIDRNENKLLQKNLADYKGKKGKLFDKYTDSARNLLNGVGDEGSADYKMGAKRAQFLIKTSKNLSKEDTDKYTKIVNRYDSYMGNSLRTAGSIIAENKEWENINGGEDGQKFVFKGQGIEQLRNRMTYFALSGKAPLDGVTYDTDVYAGENGESMVKAEITYDENSKAFLDLSEEYQKEIKANGMKLTFDQDWEDWSEDGLMSEINQGLDIEKTKKNIQFNQKDTDKISPTYAATSANYSEDSGGQTSNFTDQVINMTKLNAETLPLAQAKAKTMIAGDIGELEDYIGYTLGQGGQGFSLSDTKKKFSVIGQEKEMTIDEMRKDPKVFQEWITSLTKDHFIQESLGSDYEKRMATPDDVKLINDLNTENDIINQTGSLTTDMQVYVKKIAGSKYSSSTGPTAYEKNLNIQNQKIVTANKDLSLLLQEQSMPTFNAGVQSEEGAKFIETVQKLPNISINAKDIFTVGTNQGFKVQGLETAVTVHSGMTEPELKEAIMIANGATVKEIEKYDFGKAKREAEEAKKAAETKVQMDLLLDPPTEYRKRFPKGGITTSGTKPIVYKG